MIWQKKGIKSNVLWIVFNSPGEIPPNNLYYSFTVWNGNTDLCSLVWKYDWPLAQNCPDLTIRCTQDKLIAGELRLGGSEKGHEVRAP